MEDTRVCFDQRSGGNAVIDVPFRVFNYLAVNAPFFGRKGEIDRLILGVWKVEEDASAAQAHRSQEKA